jgi:hypothetical protein
MTKDIIIAAAHHKNIKFKRGDRVQWDGEGVTKHGTVTKGGSKVVVVVLDGGKLEVRGHPACFSPSSVPAPKDDSNPMDAWDIKNYRCLGGDETPMFTCNIAYNGKTVGTAQNSGMGGRNEYQFTNGVVHDQFLADATKWHHQFTGDNGYEPEDMWVSWKATGIGKTAKEWLTEVLDLSRDLE